MAKKPASEEVLTKSDSGWVFCDYDPEEHEQFLHSCDDLAPYFESESEDPEALDEQVLTDLGSDS